MDIVKIAWNQAVIILCALFNLMGLVLVVDISRVLFTFGDYKPVPYVFIAIILGIALFPSLGIILAKKYENSLFISFLASLVLSGIAFLYITINFFVSLLETGIIVFLLSSITTYISALIFSTFLSDLKNEPILFKVIFTDIYTFIFTLLLIIEYIILFQSLLQWLILIVEIITTIVLVVLLIYMRTHYYKSKFVSTTNIN